MDKITYSSCPLCSSSAIKSEMKLQDYSISKEDFEIYRCSACTFLFTQTIPNETHIGSYYQSEDYISHSDSHKGLVNKLYHVARNIMLGRKHNLIKSLNTGNHLLDIGCGTGYFLNYMKEKGYSTLGVEADDKTRDYGKKKFNLNILSSAEFMNGAVDKQFNIISLWHVLEHLHDPDHYMGIISKLLKEGGRLVIALPNSDSFDASYYGFLWAAYDVPRHLWHFQPKTVEFFAKKYGFEVIAMNRLPFDSFYNSMLSEKYRHNKFGFLSGAFIGLISLVRSLFDVRKSSSIIYVMKKVSDR